MQSDIPIKYALTNERNECLLSSLIPCKKKKRSVPLKDQKKSREHMNMLLGK